MDGRARGAAKPPGRRDDLPDRAMGECAAGPAAAAAAMARGRALPARLWRRGGGRARARDDGAATVDAAVQSRVHGISRVRRVRAHAARARWAAQRDAARARGAGHGICGRLGVPAVLRRGRARAVSAVTSRRAEHAADRSPRRLVYRRRSRRDRTAAAVQPLCVQFLDAPGLLRAFPASRKGSSGSPCQA